MRIAFPRHIRHSTFSLFLLGALLVSTSCSGKSQSNDASQVQELKKVRVMLDWTPNSNHLGMYVAKAKGWYRQAGLDVTFVQPGQGSDPNQAVGSKSADFGISSSEQVVQAREAKVPVVAIAAIIEHNTSSLITRKKSGIDRPRKLEGKTYGSYGGGAFEQALVRQLVACDGGNGESVKFTQVGEADYRVGLTSGAYDAVWVFDGWDVIRLRDIDHLAINTMSFRSHDGCIPDWYTPVIVAGESTIKLNPDLVKRFLGATSKGYRFAMEKPDAAAKILLKAAPGLDRNLVERSATFLSTRFAMKPARWGFQQPEVWINFVKFLEKNKVLHAGFETKEAFTNAFLPSDS